MIISVVTIRVTALCDVHVVHDIPSPAARVPPNILSVVPSRRAAKRNTVVEVTKRTRAKTTKRRARLRPN